MMLLRYGDVRQRQRRPSSPDSFSSRMARAYAGCPSTLMTRGPVPLPADKASRRKSFAAVRSRLGDSNQTGAIPVCNRALLAGAEVRTFDFPVWREPDSVLE